MTDKITTTLAAPTDGDAESLLDEMRQTVVHSHVATMSISLYNRIKAALQSTRKTPVPVDTISIKREVLMGVRDALVMNEAIYDMFFDVPEGAVSAEELANSSNAAMDLNKQALASLDAVLSEGE